MSTMPLFPRIVSETPKAELEQFVPITATIVGSAASLVAAVCPPAFPHWPEGAPAEVDRAPLLDPPAAELVALALVGPAATGGRALPPTGGGHHDEDGTQGQPRQDLAFLHVSSSLGVVPSPSIKGAGEPCLDPKLKPPAQAASL